MKPLYALIVALLLSPPAWAQGPVNHDVKVQINPAQGRVTVEDTMTIDGQGPVSFTLSSLFLVKRLRVDGRSLAPKHKNGHILIDLGAADTHEVLIVTTATLSAGPQTPFLTSEGGFLSSDWLAQPQDRLATWTISGQTPVGQKWLTTGKLTSETEDRQGYHASFTVTQPAKTPVLIIGPYKISERHTRDIRVRTYFHPELAQLADGYLSDAVRYIQDDSKKIGPYPYAGFSIVSGVTPVGWGLPGMTYIGRRVLALPFIRTTSLPHEILHNWWGNAVNVDYAHGNWAEGLTTFQADLAQSAIKNGDKGRSKRLEWLRNYAALPRNQDLAVDQFKSKSHDAQQVVGYEKTAFIFHMLKARLGQAAFTSAIQGFYSNKRFQMASWADLQTAFETASGTDLSAFFEAWVKHSGAPQLSLSHAKATDSQVTFTVTQTPSYALDIPVRVQTTRGNQDFNVHLGTKKQAFTLTAKDKVLGLQIDPDFDIFRRLQNNEMPPIFRDVTLSSAPTLQLVSHDSKVNAIARQLTKRLVQHLVQEQNDSTAPRIIVGLDADVLPLLEGTPPTAADARAYVARDSRGRTTLFVMAKDRENLARLAQALPHYKRNSFVIFNANHVVDAGVYQSTKNPLSRRFATTP